MSKSAPLRREISKSDKWNLQSLFKNDAAWEKGLKEFQTRSREILKYRTLLREGVGVLKECLQLQISLGLLEEKLGYYAMLRRDEEVSSSHAAGMWSRFIQKEAEYQSFLSFFRPEFIALPDEIVESYLQADELAEFSIVLKKIVRFRGHTLSEKEEALLAKQSEFSHGFERAFSSLTNVDFNFGTVKVDDEEVPLTQSTYYTLMESPNREVRQKSWHQFYTVFNNHKQTITELYGANVLKDIFEARIRGYKSARERALFPDKVEEKVYDNLVNTVHKGLKPLHHYYKIRRRSLHLEKLELFDLRVPLVKEATVNYSYNEGVEVIQQALAPLGEEYTATLSNGLLGGWVDRYENRDKRSGAYSAGSYLGDPYILMNYKESSINSLFTLAHEGGHSMHSWYSVRNNPFQHYNYTIFEAEVASIFNENLLSHYLLKKFEGDKNLTLFLLGEAINDFIATFFRQTMFAEFELKIHQAAEKGTPITLDLLRRTYRGLLELYFGKEVYLDEKADLEGLRIPHFYRAFYVYKYATGFAAARALSEKVLAGGEPEREAYLSFLSSGGSKYPLESLNKAGVDMAQPAPLKAAITYFEKLVKRFEILIREQDG